MGIEQGYQRVDAQVLARPSGRRTKAVIDTVVAKDPADHEARIIQSAVFLSRANAAEREAGIANLRNAPTTRPNDAQLRFVLGQALAELEQAMRGLADPKEARPLRLNYAALASALGQREKALAEYAKLVSENPESAEPRMGQAQALLRSGDISGALKALEGAPAPVRDDARFNSVLAFTLENAGRHQDAMAAYRKVLEKVPNDANMKNNLAYLLAEQGGDLGEALQLAQGALQSAPGRADYQDTLGWVHLKRGQAESAVNIFQQLVRRNPDQPVYLYHLGMARKDSGNAVAAKEALQKASAANPDPALRAKIKTALADL